MLSHTNQTGSGPAAAGSEPVILLSETAYRSFEDLLAETAPEVLWSIVSADGRVRPTPALTKRIDVAWATADLFTVGGLRSFMSLVRRSTSLQWLQAAGAGLEQPVFEELHRRGVRITSNHSSTISIAEFVMRAVLDAFQEADRWRDGEQAGAWVRHDFREVAGSTWVIVGLGHIGRAVADLAEAFGATTVGVRRDPSQGTDSAGSVGAAPALHDVVDAADVIVLAAPLTPATERMIGAEVLGRMRSNCVLVNVARGGLIDEAALLDALDRGRPCRAVLDVFHDEPLPAEHPFWTHPNVTVTPHASGMGCGRYRRGADLFVENLSRWRSGGRLLHESTGPEWARRVATEVKEN